MNNNLFKSISLTDIGVTFKETEIISGIYMIFNTKNKKVYIGQSVDIYKRWKSHKTNLEKNKHECDLLQFEYNKEENKNIFKFSIVEIVDDQYKLLEREKFYIDLYNSIGGIYNNECNLELIKTMRKYNISNNKKKTGKVITSDDINKTKKYGDLFWKLYNKNNMRFENNLKSWFENKSWDLLIKSCIIMYWFIDNYNYIENNLKLSIKHINNVFIVKIFKNNSCKDNDLIESYRFKLINGKYVPYYDLINNKEIKDTSRWILKDL